MISILSKEFNKFLYKLNENFDKNNYDSNYDSLIYKYIIEFSMLFEKNINSLFENKFKEPDENSTLLKEKYDILENKINDFEIKINKLINEKKDSIKINKLINEKKGFY